THQSHRTRPLAEDLVRDARVCQGRQGRLLLPQRGEVQGEVRDVRLQRQREARRRLHVAGRLRAEEADRSRRGKDPRAREESGELRTELATHARAGSSELRLRGHQHVAAAARPLRAGRRTHERRPMNTNTTTVTTPNELEILVERIFDAPRAHVFSVWTDPKLIPAWWGDGTVVEEMDVRPGGTYRFRTAHGVVEGEFREVDVPERLVQTFMNHLQTLEFEDLGDQTKLTQT